MLVLSRKRDDVILIGDDVRITIVKIDRSSVRIGIEAPSTTSILRQELLLDAEELASKVEWEAANA